MGEQPSSQWDLLKLKLGNARLRAKSATEGFTYDQGYKMTVPSEKQERASITSEAFAGEVLDFIGDNPSERLSKLQLTRDQMGVVYFLLDSVEGGSLTLRKTKGRIQDSVKRPYLIKEYEAGELEEIRGGLVAGSSDLFSKGYVAFVVRWDVNKNFPLGFTIFGDVGAASANIDFITLDRKAESPAYIDEYLGSVDKVTATTGVYQNGERITFNREVVYKGDQYSMTHQYYFIGEFDGLNTEKTYWVYGMNRDKQSQMSVREGAGARELATKKVRY